MSSLAAGSQVNQKFESTEKIDLELPLGLLYYEFFKGITRKTQIRLNFFYDTLRDIILLKQRILASLTRPLRSTRGKNSKKTVKGVLTFTESSKFLFSSISDLDLNI